MDRLNGSANILPEKQAEGAFAGQLSDLAISAVIQRAEVRTPPSRISAKGSDVL